MYLVSSTPVGSLIGTGSIVGPGTPTPQSRWTIELYHRSGGLKKQWFIGQDDCPISAFEFEQNKTGCGKASIDFSYLDFPIDADDYAKIYYKGTVKYTGIVDVKPDVKYGKIELIPVWRRYEETLYNGTFTTKTYAEILNTVVSAAASATGILWNASLVNTGSSATITITYNYEPVKKIVEDLISRMSNRYWGVREDNFFYVKEFDTTTAHTLFYTDSPAFSEIEIETDYSGIEATRYQVYKKVSGSGATTRIGEVGYGGSYPIIPLEKLVRIKEAKITVSEVLSDAEALAYAYAKLLAQQATIYNTMKNVCLDEYNPTVGEYITVQDREDSQIYTIIACDTVTNWVNATLDTSDFVEGSGSVYFNATSIGQYMEYAMGKQVIYKNPQKLGFMLKSSLSGNFLIVKIYMNKEYKQYGYGSGAYGDNAYGEGDITGEESNEIVFQNNIAIASANTWNFFQFDMTNPISKIRFEIVSAPGGTAKISVDRIQLFADYRAVYDDNVVQINYNILPTGEIVDVKLSNYDPKANEILFGLDEKIKILENTNVQ